MSETWTVRGHVEPGFERVAQTFRENFLERGEVEEATTLLEAAARLQPDHEWTNVSLGMAYLRQGRNQDAYKNFLVVRRLYPTNWVAPLGIALAHVNSGQPEQARAHLDEALRLGGPAARAEAQRYPGLAPLLDQG